MFIILTVWNPIIVRQHFSYKLLQFCPSATPYRRHIFSTSSPGCLFNQATDFWGVITSYVWKELARLVLASILVKSFFCFWLYYNDLFGINFTIFTTQDTSIRKSLPLKLLRYLRILQTPRSRCTDQQDIGSYLWSLTPIHKTTNP